MTAGDDRRYFLAFGRVIESDIDLPLLTPTPGPLPSGVEARIVLCPEPISVPSETITRDVTLPVTVHRDGAQLMVALHRLGWAVRLEKSPVTLSLHPLSGSSQRPGRLDESNSRILGDRIVTNVLPYLPQLWGFWGIHGAFLGTPRGGIMLLAPSGFGKSTLSRVLSRDHGWEILDDDTSMVASASPTVSLVPMGAQSRLREDAAKYLGIEIDSLESYAGRKGLSQGKATTVIQPSPVLKGFVTLVPDAPEQIEPDGKQGPFSAPLRGLDAMRSLFESFFSLESDLRETLQDQLTLATELSRLPHVSVHYRKGVHTPEQTAEEIVKAHSTHM